MQVDFVVGVAIENSHLSRRISLQNIFHEELNHVTQNILLANMCVNNWRRFVGILKKTKLATGRAETVKMVCIIH